MLTRCHKRATDQATCIFHRATTRRTQRPTVRRARPRLPQTAATLNPDIFRMQFPPSNNQRELKNRRISTIPFQNLKYTQGNCMRHCWGTTPVFQTEEPTGVEGAQWPGGPGCGADTRHRESPQTNFARNLTRSFFETGHKRCNSNHSNSTFEQASGELRATLLGNHSGISNGSTPQPTGRARTPHPRHDEAATGFPATASSRSRSAVQHSATDQAVMSTWSSTAARPASRRATGTRNGEQDT